MNAVLLHRLDSPKLAPTAESLEAAFAIAKQALEADELTDVALEPEIDVRLSTAKWGLGQVLAFRPQHPIHRLDELAEAMNRIRGEAATDVNRTRAEKARLQAEQTGMGVVPRALDALEVAIDGEVRAIFRAMTEKQRAALFAEMREGRQQRAMVALARSPITDDISAAAEALHREFSDPEARRRYALQLELTEIRRRAGEALVKAAEAIARVVDIQRIFAEAEAARRP